MIAILKILKTKLPTNINDNGVFLFIIINDHCFIPESIVNVENDESLVEIHVSIEETYVDITCPLNVQPLYEFNIYDV